MLKRPEGIALIIVVGVLGITAVLATAFVTMARLERQASLQRTNAARAFLLARSGLEDAQARLALGQDIAYLGEDWDASGTLNGCETVAEVYQPGVLNITDCPVQYALRPSFPVMTAGFPVLVNVDGRSRGYSGLLVGDQGPAGNHYVLKAGPMNGRIHVNGGSLAAQDTSNDGPNGFLVRLLNNLDDVVTSGATSNLGVQVVANRPPAGYGRVGDLLPVLGQARYDQFKNHLTTVAWVDPKVVKPQLMETRPNRFQDIDDTHRGPTATAAVEISGVTTAGGGGVQLNPGIIGTGTSDAPWTQTITATNGYETGKTYPVKMERNAVYAWSQLRLAPPAMEPRAPVSVNGASKEVLAAVFEGLRGTYLEVWDGSAGWDDGEGGGSDEYSYPDQAHEDTPWHRTRVDYGMTYGTVSRPWYGPQDYNPQAPARDDQGGKPVIQAEPLGRLKETTPITRAQAMALADEIRRRTSEAGPFRTWAQFNAFVDTLPAWEDMDDDGVMDGTPYTVHGTDKDYTRRIYRREDLNSDGILSRQVFTRASGTWTSGLTWQDPGLGRAALPPGQAPGLTFLQKDVIKAMANPNTDLNDFNPDRNLWKEVDKTDLAGIADAPASYAHTTELSLDDTGYYDLRSLGRVLSSQGRLLAQRQLESLLSRGDSLLGGIYRDTTQADFMRGRPPGTVFTNPPVPYPLAGNQALVSYPDPTTDAAYDGQIGLGFISAMAGPEETLRGDLFDTTDATADSSSPDLRGPSLLPLVSPSAQPTGNVFPDGVYSEKDRSLKFPMLGHFDPIARDSANGNPYYYMGFWVKPNWFPEACPRPHALVSLSRGGWDPTMPADGTVPYDGFTQLSPTHDLCAHPVGLYFVPARNNETQGAMDFYDQLTGAGTCWPSRSLIWGTTHNFYASDTLQRRGIETAVPATKPVGRLEGHRWQHVGLTGMNSPGVRIWLDRCLAASAPGLDAFDGEWINPSVQLSHADGTPNHLRFGELASENNMNYVADATFANVRVGKGNYPGFFATASSPGGLGRYVKEHGATYTSAKLPAGIQPLRITWTEIPCDLWFDGNNDGSNQDGWMGDAVNGYAPRNFQFLSGNAPAGPRDVHIDLELWDDNGKLAVYHDPGASNPVPSYTGQLYYKAVFVNAWDVTTRLNNPLNVTPYLDDVTITLASPSGMRVLAGGDAHD